MNAPTKPRYQQLKEQIIVRISKGELKPRDRVPSEHELVRSAGVSRMTANRALRELDDEGYVERVAGVGTFVADLKASSHVLEVRNIADEIRLRGHEHCATVLKHEVGPAEPDIADLLQIIPGSNVNHVLLIHCENSLPIQLEDRYATVDFAPDFLLQDFRVVSPSAYLTTIAPLQHAEHVVRAKRPSAYIRKCLEMNTHEPCLVVTRRTWVQHKPVSFALLHHPGDRFELAGQYAPVGSRKRYPRATAIAELERMDR